MRLIDADQFGVIALQGKSEEFIEGVLFILDKIYEAPTIEERPHEECTHYKSDRPHGKWVPGREVSQMWTGDKLVAIDYEDFSCSCCGVVVEESTEPEWNFCPNCGADMRKEGDQK